MSSDKFDPKLWEGWDETARGYARNYYSSAGAVTISVAFMPVVERFMLNVSDGEDFVTLDYYETQQEALKVANAIGGWE